MSSPHRDILKQLTLLAAAMVIAVAAGEAVLRLVFSGQKAHYVWPPHRRSTWSPISG